MSRERSVTGARERLVLVTTRALPELGGIESHVHEVSSRLRARGVPHELVTTDLTGMLGPWGDGVRRFRAYPRNRDWFASPGLFLHLLRGRYDLLHVQGIHTLVPPLAMLAAIVRRRPFVLTFHTGGSSSDFRRRARGAQFRILAPLLRRAAALIAVSHFEAELFESVLGLPAGSIRVIRNGGALPEVGGPVDVEPDLIVSVGRLEKYKGHHRAIEALPYVLKQRPDARLQILGQGPYEAALRELAAELGVSERVDIGFVAPADRGGMGRAMSRAGVMVLLSDYEAHPVAVMEALALDRPAVVLETSGLTELACTGWVRGVASDASTEQIAEAIVAQLEDPIAIPSGDLPDWDGCVDELQDVYRSV